MTRSIRRFMAAKNGIADPKHGWTIDPGNAT